LSVGPVARHGRRADVPALPASPADRRNDHSFAGRPNPVMGIARDHLRRDARPVVVGAPLRGAAGCQMGRDRAECRPGQGAQTPAGGG